MSVVTLRYAHAFANVARSSDLDATRAQQQLEDFAATLHGSAELREFFGNPSLIEGDKLRILDAIAGRIGMFPQVRNFVAVIIAHERLSEMDEILVELSSFVDEQSSIHDAEITSARPLHDADRIALEARVAQLAGGPIRATYHEDSTLLGGAIVRIGSTVYDGSVKAQLERLKQQLVQA